MDAQLLVWVAVVALFVAVVLMTNPDRSRRRRPARRSRWNTRPPS